MGVIYNLISEVIPITFVILPIRSKSLGLACTQNQGPYKGVNAEAGVSGTVSKEAYHRFLLFLPKSSNLICCGVLMLLTWYYDH